MPLSPWSYFCITPVLIDWLCHAEWGILVPRPGIELLPSALEVLSLHYWTDREVSTALLYNFVVDRMTTPHQKNILIHPSRSFYRIASKIINNMKKKSKWSRNWKSFCISHPAAQSNSPLQWKSPPKTWALFPSTFLPDTHYRSHHHHFLNSAVCAVHLFMKISSFFFLSKNILFIKIIYTTYELLIFAEQS